MAQTDTLSWARYNADVMATTCRRCGAGERERCKGSAASITIAHHSRYTDAGYRWDDKAKALVKIDLTPQG